MRVGGGSLARVYRALLVAQLQNAAQYRVQVFLWLLFAVVRPVVFLAAWTAVATTQGGAVAGYSVADFAGYYVCLTLVIQLTGAWHAWDFEVEVRHGRLSSKLLRPLHPIHYAVIENIVQKLFTLAGLVPVLVLIALSFGARFQTQWWHVVLFVPSIVLAWGISFLLSWVIATAAFWTTRVAAVQTLMDRVSFIFAGQIAPVSVLPGVLGSIAAVLPYAYIFGLPADLLRGGPSNPGAVLPLLLGQVGWLVALYALLQVAWRQGVRAYSAVGA